MNIKIAVIASFLGLTLAGCENQSQLPEYGGLERFGLSDRPVDHSLLMEAIKSANVILPADAQKFAAGWITNEKSGTPVYTVGSQLGPSEIMATFAECRCVVVQAGALNAWLAEKTGESSALLTIEPKTILSYMLLHEAGHIAGDATIQDVSEAAPTQAIYNLDSSAQKNRELRADTYAASAIKLALQDGGSRGLRAAELSMTLANLSWNLTAHRLLDDFGGTALRKPTLFWDDGLSHPNLEWRILVVNDLIEGTETSHKLLTDFEAFRSGGIGGALWHATPGEQRP